MKYIILPVIRFIVVLFSYLVLIPLVYIFAFLSAIWTLNWRYIRELNEEPFYLEKDFAKDVIDNHTGVRSPRYYYKTGIDYLLQRKRYKI